MPNPFRRQLASNSPIAASDLLTGAAAVLGRSAVPEVRLTKLLTREYGVSGSTLCRSGTQALVLALRTAESILSAPATVALPAFSCFDLISAVVRFGRPVRFYEVDPRTLGPDPDSVSAALARGANIVVVAGLYGVPVDWRELDPLLEASGALVIEDAAQMHGARWNGARLGGHGRLGVLSFARGKGWTGGLGGAMLVRDETDLPHALAPTAERPGMVSSAAATVRAVAHWALGRPGLYGIPASVPALRLGVTTYHPVGEPEPMPRAAIAMALSSYERAEAEVSVRRAAAAEYRDALEASRGVEVAPIPEGGEGGWIRFPLVLGTPLGASSDADQLGALGVAASYPTPLPRLDVVAPLLADEAERALEWPSATLLTERLVTLPTHGRMRTGERTRLVELLARSD